MIAFALSFLFLHVNGFDSTPENVTSKPACECKASWSYPKDYASGNCVGPFHECPNTPCDGDGSGPWCVVTNNKCKTAQKYTDDGTTYHYAYCTPSTPPPSPPPSGPVLSPDDAKIRYIGRFDYANPKAPRLEWSMAGMSVSFHGSKSVFASLTFPSKGGRVRVIVDGATKGFVEARSASSMRQYKLVDDLDETKPHTLEIYKVTEDGVMTFGGFQLSSGQFDTAPKSPTRKMEFIGDSDTAGWCADGSASTGDAESKFEDAYVTWAQQLARSFQAEPMVEAVSGWGVTKASTPIQTVLDYSVRSSKTKWDYSQWTPDAVVLLIGPNDESLLKARAEGSSFVKQYKTLLDMIATNYKHATPAPKIVHVCGGSLNGLDPCEDIQTANNQFNQEQSQSGSKIKGYYTSITKEHWNLINGPHGKGTSQYNGCDGHYNEKGHQVLAQDILPQLQKIMGWQVPFEPLLV